MNSRPHIDDLSSEKHTHRQNLSENELEAEIRSLQEQQRRLQRFDNFQRAAQPPPTRSRDYDPGDVLKTEYRFNRTEEDDANAKDSWEAQLARTYEEGLFKEFALADLSRYKHGKIGLRWRIEKEVRSGKGERICGNKVCSETKELEQYEVPFKYKEAGVEKMTLVKLTVCPECAQKVNYRSRHEKVRDKAPKQPSPPPSNDSSQLVREPGLEQVVAPESQKRDLIDSVAHFAHHSGTNTEDMLKGGAANRLDLGFLRSEASPERTYYLWRLTSFQRGDDLAHWSMDPIQLSPPNGPYVLPPNNGSTLNHTTREGAPSNLATHYATTSSTNPLTTAPNMEQRKRKDIMQSEGESGPPAPKKSKHNETP